MTRANDLRVRFLDLHHHSPAAGTLVLPNPWDIGSSKILAALGAQALATTSAGFAGTLGRTDQQITRDELIAHVAELASASDLPFNVDAEDCFADDLDGVAETVGLIAATDAAGFSIEDFDPRANTIRPLDVAVERVATAKQAGGDLVVTARAEALLHPDLTAADLGEIIERLKAFREAGADVLYAPGLRSLDDITRVVDEVDGPVNVLALPGTPTVPELAAAGVARVSVGSLFFLAAYGALATAAQEVFGPGTADYFAAALDGRLSKQAFG